VLANTDIGQSFLFQPDSIPNFRPPDIASSTIEITGFPRWLADPNMSALAPRMSTQQALALHFTASSNTVVGEYCPLLQC